MSASGRLDCRVTIQRHGDPTQDEFGEPITPWVDVATVWAQVMPMRGEELLAAQQVQSRADTKIRVRWQPGLRPSMRVIQRVELDGSAPTRGYDIVAVLPEATRKDFITLMCVQRDADGFRLEK